MTRMHSILAALAVTAALGGYADDVKAAKADYARRAALGEEPRYLYVGALPGEMQEQAVIALAFWVPHLTLESVLEYQIPERLGETAMYRIDLNNVGWGRKAWIELNKENPYIHEHWHDPLIIRADWLLNITSDASDSQAYYTLLYAQVGTPKNKADWLKIHNVNAKDLKDRTAVILDKGRSGVALETRLMAEARDGWHWETFDSRNAVGKGDPHEQLEGGLKFDAQELIARVKKVHLKKGERTFVQAYLLTNGQGIRQDEAPTDIVVDKTGFRSQPSVRTPGSCIACHLPLNGPPHNALRDRIAEGVAIGSTDQKFIDQTYLSKHEKLIERSVEDFALFTELACGIKNPAIPRANWIEVVEFYDANVTLEQAAREVYAANGRELQLAIAYYSERIGPQDGVARLSELPHGFAIPRKAWEGNRKKHEIGVYHLALAAMELWRNKK